MAEELECDWSKITTEYPTPGENVKRSRVWKNYSTGGSRGIRESNQYVREGGAIAREMLIAAAAAEWKVPATECTAANSIVTHSSGKKLTYGHLAAAAAKLEPPKEVKLKDPKDWKIAGKPIKRLDTLPKLTGQMIYGIDVKLPNMLTASVKACPVIGGKLKSFDAARVEKMPGVKKVVSIDGNAVAVIADTYWNAKTALEKLPVEWDVGKLGDVQQDQITAMLKEGLDASEAFIGNKAGDAKAAIDGAAKKVEATYSLPLAAPRQHGADERHRALDARQVRGVVRHAERRGGPCGRRRRRPICRSPSATSTSRCWAPASAGAAAPTMCGRPCWSPSRCPERRSRWCGRAKRT